MLCLIAISVSGCATISGDYCVVARPIVYEQSDVDVISDTLADSIVRHNLKHETICKDD